jgi:hypothetical protein
MRPHLQNNKSKIDWKYGSSDREPALQKQSLEFKLQHNLKKEKERK